MTETAACPDTSRLFDLLAERVSAQDEVELQTHLEHCPACQENLELLVASEDSCEVGRRLEELDGETSGLSLADTGAALKAVIGHLRSLDLCATRPDAEALADGRRDYLLASTVPGSLGRLGNYEVLDVLGRGGMGVVYKALDTDLQRVVALKVLAPHLASRPLARRRFLREARLSAAIVQENIVPIYAVLECDGVPFLVMQYVEGVSLQQRLDSGGRCSATDLVRIGLQLARGLAAAHERGVIHRDIKPANILLQTTEHTEDTEKSKNGPSSLPSVCSVSSVVKITDFGLARTTDDLGCTESGVAVGTPAFMSPEQAQAQPLDARSDLFSLGSVLYALCTGQPPFNGERPLAVLKRVCEAEPASLRELNPEIPAWLSSLIERLHAKDRQDRPASAAEVAAYLEQGLAHMEQPERVPAPVGPPKPRRRHRTALLVAGLLLTCVGLGEGTGVSNLLQQPNSLRPVPAAGSGKPEPLRILRGHQGPVQRLVVSHDSQWVLSASGWPKGDGTIRLWDLSSGGEVRAFTGHSGDINVVALSPSGRQFLSAGADATVRLWDLGSGQEVRCLEGHVGPVSNVVWSADGNTALSSGADHTIRLWDIASGKETTRFEGHTDLVRAIAFSPEGRHVLSGSRDGTLRLWDISSGREVRCFDLGPDWINWVAFTSDGRQALLGRQAAASLSAGVADHLAALWNLETGQEVRRYPGHLHGVLQVSLSPDGRYLLTGCYDGNVRLYEFETGRLLQVLADRGEFVWTVAFTPDGRHFLSGGGGRSLAGNFLPGQDHAIHLWELRAVLALPPPAP